MQNDNQVQQQPKKAIFVLPPKLQEKYNFYVEKYKALPKNTQKLLMVVGVLFAIIFILLLLAVLFAPSKKPAVIATPAPTPVSVSPTPNVVSVSRYASDEGVLRIENNLNEIQKSLNILDVRQTDLTQPTLDFDIDFN